MEKLMCYGAIGVAAVLGLLFLVDLVAGIPFGRGPFIAYDIIGLLAGGIIGYLGFNALKDVK